MGFRDVRSADGDKRDLVDLLRADLVRTDLLRMESGDRAPLLYLAGEDRAGDLAAAGLPVHTAVVYRALKAEHFPPPVAAALAQGALDGVLHFSARSAEAYLDCAAHDAIRESALAPVHYCLSRQVAAPLSAAGAAGGADCGPPRRDVAAGACGIGVRQIACPGRQRARRSWRERMETRAQRSASRDGERSALQTRDRYSTRRREVPDQRCTASFARAAPHPGHVAYPSAYGVKPAG